MPDPSQHAQSRGVIESILRYIPGFKGYLEQGYRRESDRLQRKWLADRLQRAKQGINGYTLELTNTGQLDLLPACEQMRSCLDRLISRLEGSISGYSGFFDFVQINEDDLDDIYALDHSLISKVETLAQQLESLPTASDQATLLLELAKHIQAVEKKVDQREDVLRGLGE